MSVCGSLRIEFIPMAAAVPTTVAIAADAAAGRRAFYGNGGEAAAAAAHTACVRRIYAANKPTATGPGAAIGARLCPYLLRAPFRCVQVSTMQVRRTVYIYLI